MTLTMHPAGTLTGVAVAIVVAAIMWACALHHPVDVWPDYPTTAADAGADR